MFQWCTNMKSLNLSNWNTSNVQYMNYMFYMCQNLVDLSGIANWDTNNITNIEKMFGDCNNLSIKSYKEIANMLPQASQLTNRYISNIGLNVQKFGQEQLRILNNKGYIDAVYVENKQQNYILIYNAG